MFKQIVLDLIHSGLSEQEIADYVGTSQPSVNRIKLGKQGKSGVKYETGVKLIELHKARVRPDEVGNGSGRRSSERRDSDRRDHERRSGERRKDAA